MAVLEKIRKRSVLLFIIIIGALLAFILGDFLNSGRSLFGPGDTMAQVDNVKVKQMDFNEQSENLENQIKATKAMGQNVPAEYNDPGYRYQLALDNALFEKLMEQEYERMGIEVNDEFVTKFVSNPSYSGVVMNNILNEMGDNPQLVWMQLNQAGIVDPASFLDAIRNPERYQLPEGTSQALSAAWKGMENTIVRQVQYQLYNQMVDAMMLPNKADAKAYFDNQNVMAKVRSASVPLNSVKDDEVTVEEADYEAVYDKIKDAYKILDENREVAFIIVPIVPSDADYADADTQASQLVAALKLGESADIVKASKGFKHDNMKVTEADLGRNMQLVSLRADSTGLQKGVVKEVRAPRGTKTVVKINDVITGIDNVKFTFMPIENEKMADSLFVNKSVTAVDSVITAMGAGSELVDITTSLVNPDNQYASNEVIAEALKTAPLNQYYFVNDTVNNIANGVLVVKERAAAVPVYDLSLYTYEVYPSEKTRQDLTQKFHNYVANHPQADKFANDTTGTYTAMFTMVNPLSTTLSSPQLTPGTRGVVKWVMDIAKKGSVSPVYTLTRTMSGRNGQPDESQDYLLAAAVIDVYDDYVPYTSKMVHDNLQPKVMADKKAKVLIDKYNGKGKTIAEYAKAMGVTTDTLNIAFGAGTIGGNAQGALAAAQKGQLVGPVQGVNGVYVFQVDDVTAPDFDAVELSERLTEATRGLRKPQVSLPMLVGNRRIQNNTLRFTQTPDAE